MSFYGDAFSATVVVSLSLIKTQEVNKRQCSATLAHVESYMFVMSTVMLTDPSDGCSCLIRSVFLLVPAYPFNGLSLKLLSICSERDSSVVVLSLREFAMHLGIRRDFRPFGRCSNS